jgi:hypothetical protein
VSVTLVDETSAIPGNNVDQYVFETDMFLSMKPAGSVLIGISVLPLTFPPFGRFTVN